MIKERLWQIISGSIKREVQEEIDRIHENANSFLANSFQSYVICFLNFLFIKSVQFVDPKIYFFPIALFSFRSLSCHLLSFNLIFLSATETVFLRCNSNVPREQTISSRRDMSSLIKVIAQFRLCSLTRKVAIKCCTYVEHTELFMADWIQKQYLWFLIELTWLPELLQKGRLNVGNANFHMK